MAVPDVVTRSQAAEATVALMMVIELRTAIAISPRLPSSTATNSSDSAIAADAERPCMAPLVVVYLGRDPDAAGKIDHDLDTGIGLGRGPDLV